MKYGSWIDDSETLLPQQQQQGWNPITSKFSLSEEEPDKPITSIPFDMNSISSPNMAIDEDEAQYSVVSNNDADRDELLRVARHKEFAKQDMVPPFRCEVPRLMDPGDSATRDPLDRRPVRKLRDSTWLVNRSRRHNHDAFRIVDGVYADGLSKATAEHVGGGFVDIALEKEGLLNCGVPISVVPTVEAIPAWMSSKILTKSPLNRRLTAATPLPPTSPPHSSEPTNAADTGSVEGIMISSGGGSELRNPDPYIESEGLTYNNRAPMIKPMIKPTGLESSDTRSQISLASAMNSRKNNSATTTTSSAPTGGLVNNVDDRQRLVVNLSDFNSQQGRTLPNGGVVESNAGGSNIEEHSTRVAKISKAILGLGGPSKGGLNKVLGSFVESYGGSKEELHMLVDRIAMNELGSRYSGASADGKRNPNRPPHSNGSDRTAASDVNLLYSLNQIMERLDRLEEGSVATSLGATFKQPVTPSTSTPSRQAFSSNQTVVGFVRKKGGRNRRKFLPSNKECSFRSHSPPNKHDRAMDSESESKDGTKYYCKSSSDARERDKKTYSEKHLMEMMKKLVKDQVSILQNVPKPDNGPTLAEINALRERVASLQSELDAVQITNNELNNRVQTLNGRIVVMEREKQDIRDKLNQQKAIGPASSGFKRAPNMHGTAAPRKPPGIPISPRAYSVNSQSTVSSPSLPTATTTTTSSATANWSLPPAPTNHISTSSQPPIYTYAQPSFLHMKPNLPTYTGLPVAHTVPSSQLTSPLYRPSAILTNDITKYSRHSRSLVQEYNHFDAAAPQQ
eukprot:GHVH01005823.1.p1 GENE.GHVH01005823.1~~GHVH01005823.1.p1  ORF type:complete len:794 (-),score=97.53 GHVH01005823.1:1252-3633(-)